MIFTSIVSAFGREMSESKANRAVPSSSPGESSPFYRVADRDGEERAREQARQTRKESQREEKLLVRKSLDGDKDAYRELMERYQDRVYRLAFEVLRNPEDAEDVVQESFVKAYLSLKNFRGQASFYTWLYRIVYNMAIDYKRRITRRGGNPLSFRNLI